MVAILNSLYQINYKMVRKINAGAKGSLQLALGQFALS